MFSELFLVFNSFYVLLSIFLICHYFQCFKSMFLQFFFSFYRKFTDWGINVRIVFWVTVSKVHYKLISFWRNQNYLSLNNREYKSYLHTPLNFFFFFFLPLPVFSLLSKWALSFRVVLTAFLIKLLFILILSHQSILCRQLAGGFKG